ncbi:hypothetical protein MmiEs2_08550 [Methanimicrococcus stummii]|uniref:DUF2769 domain-containing protein n=1 Tax=Methanimicrococcus stummii TaxID=3028294 RepID=A0AA96ZX48_9EURY|nr:DUF2769 domain-containing protein [Methanimicrococcus sp. Es2]WNY28655.1 hypothetical protein MmiEs2_08550 [Methanimicrococcus sp. Es2]
MADEREQKFGKYFGVCASFHHSKACLCPTCALRPDFGNIMYCAKGSCPTYGSGDENGEVGTIVDAEKEENTICLCEKCAVYKQFSMEGSDFCVNDNKTE